MNNRTLRRDYGLGATPIPDWAGDVVVTDKTSQYYTAAPAVTPKKSAWDVIDNILNIGQKTANVVTTVIPSDKAVTIPGSTSPSAPVVITQPAPVQSSGMSTTTKVLIGTGIAAVVGFGTYLAFGRKKKGLGCPETPALGGVKKKRKSRRK